jgi:hypothetical protein
MDSFEIAYKKVSDIWKNCCVKQILVIKIETLYSHLDFSLTQYKIATMANNLRCNATLLNYMQIEISILYVFLTNYIQ